MSANLPAIYGISAAALFDSTAAFLQQLEKVLRQGSLRLLQVRERSMDTTQLLRFACDCIALCHAHGCRVLLNAEPSLVREAQADGIHLPSNSLAKKLDDRDGLLVGASCHNADELTAAFENANADFAVLSPVQRTNSHINTPPLGWEGFSKLAAQHTKPVYALGGLRLSDAQQAQQHGAAGIASMRDIWGLPSSA